MESASFLLGGRPKTARRNPQPDQYDLRTAHPAAMLHIPCPLHTRSEHQPRANQLPDGGLYLAKANFFPPHGPGAV
jgi:hypothetical protein